jgi:hypothetical protein
MSPPTAFLSKNAVSCGLATPGASSHACAAGQRESKYVQVPNAAGFFSVTSCTILRGSDLVHLGHSLLELLILALFVAVSFLLIVASVDMPEAAVWPVLPRTSMADSIR